MCLIPCMAHIHKHRSVNVGGTHEGVCEHRRQVWKSFPFTQASKELQQAQTSRPESTQIQPQPGEKGRNPKGVRDFPGRGGERLGAGRAERKERDTVVELRDLGSEVNRDPEGDPKRGGGGQE